MANLYMTVNTNTVGPLSNTHEGPETIDYVIMGHGITVAYCMYYD